MKTQIVKKIDSNWAFLESLHQKKYLPTVDLALARRLLPDGSEAAGAFLCHLSLATRSGHLCVTRDQPDVQELWQSEECALSGEEWQRLRELILEGMNGDAPVVIDGDRFYFPRYWEEETLFLKHFRRVIQAKPKWEIELGTFGDVNAEQQEAIYKSSQRVFSIICGGPGTGKTYTVGIFLRELSKLLPIDTKIALAAPTGKATANLQASLTSALQGHPWSKSLIAKTLHTLLGVNKRELQKIAADIVIVDECSMIDARLMHQLFASIRTGCRLILLGDPYQLPPVEVGSLFGDLIEGLRGAQFEAVQLKQCLRAESAAIINFAEGINQGKLIENEISIEPLPHLHKLYERVKYTDDIRKIHEFRLLSPLRRGLYGVNYINNYFLKRSLKQMERGPFTFPILITGNDPKMDLYNGDLGILVRQEKEGIPKKGDHALFFARGTGAIRQVPMLLLPQYEYAYCLSVHKSQGSEFDEVMLLMPEGSEVFGRKVFYTGVTRAKKRLEVFSSQDTLNQTVAKNYSRISGIKTRLFPLNG